MYPVTAYELEAKPCNQIEHVKRESTPAEKTSIRTRRWPKSRSGSAAGDDSSRPSEWFGGHAGDLLILLKAERLRQQLSLPSYISDIQERMGIEPASLFRDSRTKRECSQPSPPCDDTPRHSASDC